MPPCAAIARLQKMAKRMISEIERTESVHGYANHALRSEFGAIRASLFQFGMPRHELPETPFLDPSLPHTYAEWAARQEKTA